MNKRFEELLESRLDGPTDALTPSDLQALSGAAKNVLDARKIENELRLAAGQAQLEKMKTVALVIVPLASILAVCATIWTHSDDRVSTSRIEEAKEWRKFVSSPEFTAVRRSNLPIRDSIVPATLSSFMSTTSLKDTPRSIAINLMGRLADPVTFREFLKDVTSPLDRTSLGDLSNVGRDLRSWEYKIIGLCQERTKSLPSDMSTSDALKNADPTIGVCDPSVKLDAFKATHPSEVEESKTLQLDRADNREEEVALSKAICAPLRNTLPSASKPAYRADSRDLDLMAGIHLIGCNFSDLDFTGTDLTDTWLEDVNLSGTKLSPAKSTNLSLYSTNWWEAQSMDQPLLERTAIDFHIWTADEKATSAWIVFARRIEPVESVADIAKGIARLCTSGHCDPKAP